MIELQYYELNNILHADLTLMHIDKHVQRFSD